MAAKKPRGRPFASGQSGNPGGRPAVPEDVREAFRKYSMPAAQKLFSLLNCGEAELELKAATAILDRALGRPAQAVEVSGPQGAPVALEGVSTEDIRELLRRKE